MARKRIADLLNEEVEKLATENDDATSDPTLDNTNNEENPVVKSTRTTAARRNPTRTTRQTTNQNNQELEGVVSELRVTLEQVQKSEELLQQQVVDLQRALDSQKALAKQFKQELESTDSLKAELEQAKRTIVQLAEANSNLIEERTPAKKENQESQAIQPVSTKSQYKSARQTVIFPDQNQENIEEGDYVDFAKNSWLL